MPRRCVVLPHRCAARCRRYAACHPAARRRAARRCGCAASRRRRAARRCAAP